MIKMFHGLISNTNGNYDTRLSSYYDQFKYNYVFKYTVRALSFVLILTLLVTREKYILYYCHTKTAHDDLALNLYLITLQNTKDRYTIKLLSTRR